MTAELVGHFTPGTPEWLEARKRRLGGSEIAAVLGLSPYESRFSLWHRKMGTIGPQDQKPEMEWGNRLEPVIAEKFIDAHRDQLGGYTGGTYVHSDRDWQTASPDLLIIPLGQTEVSALLEVKTSIYGDGWGETGTDEIPVYYRCQVLWYLDVMGLETAHIAVLISGYDYREYMIKLDDQARQEIQVLRQAGKEFIDSLTLAQRPPIDEHDETYKIIRELHPDITPDEDHDLDEGLALDYLETKDAVTAAEKRHKVIRSTVLDAMGSANYGRYLDERIVRRQSKEGGTPFLASTRKDPRGKPQPKIEAKKAS